MPDRGSGVTVTLGLLGLILALVWLSAGSSDGARAANLTVSADEISIVPATPPDYDSDASVDTVVTGTVGHLLDETFGHYTDIANYGCLAQRVDVTQWSAMSSGTWKRLNNVWGSSGSDVFAVGEYGTILHYDGMAWSKMTSGTTDLLLGVWGSSDSDVFAVGGSGTILHYNGTTWSEMSNPGGGLSAVWGSSSSDVFAVGSLDTIMHYNGTAWSHMSSGSTAGFHGVWGNSGNDVFAVGNGGAILHYNGTAWSAMDSGVGIVLDGVWGSSGNDVFAVGGPGTIVHYNGTSWSTMFSGTTKPLYGVWGSSGSDVFAVGGGGTILHYDGTTWSEMGSGRPSPLQGVWGSSGTDVFAVGNYGIILHYSGLYLALAKAVQPDTTVLAREPITFTVAFSNAGTVRGTNVLITDVVPAEVTLVAFDNSLPVTPAGMVSYTWLLGDLLPGAGGVITITGVLSTGLPPGYAFTNVVTVSATTLDGYPAVHHDSVRVSIQATPVAVDDSYTTTENTPLTVTAPGVLGNDRDPNDDPLTAVLDNPPLNGTLVLNADGSFAYSPRLRFAGADSFSYHATDTISDSNVAEVMLTVQAPLTRCLYLPMTLRNLACPDFFDDFSDPSTGWEVVDNEFVHSHYVDGEFRVLTKQAGYIYLFKAPTCDRQDYVVEVSARWVGTPGSSYGLLFGLADDFSRYYLFDINTYYALYRLLRRGPDGFTEVVPITEASAINGGTYWNRLKATRIGDQITLEVNGSVLGTWTDGTITGSTKVGIVSSPYSTLPISDARFDNFSVVTSAGSGAMGGYGAQGTTATDGQASEANTQRDPVPVDMGW